MSHFFSAPGILFAPKHDLKVSVDPFVSQGIPDTAFETVQVDIPIDPIITFPDRPDIDDPDVPIAPEISLDDLIPEQLFSLEIETAPQEKVDISIPADIDLREFDSDVPEFKISEPDGRVDWEYEEFSYALSKILTDRYDLLILPVEYFSRLQKRNSSIWDDQQDWLEQRGNENNYLKRKELDNARSSNNSSQWKVIEDYKNDLALTKLFISGRQSHEEILRRHHDIKQKLNFSFVQSVMDGGVKHFSACVQAFQAKIASYRELASIYLGDITRQSIKIQELQARFTISQSIGQYNSAVLARLQAEIAVQKGVIEFFRSQMALAQAEIRVEVLQAQIERLEIQVFAELSKAEVDRLRQDIAEQEAEIAKASVAKFISIKERLLANLEVSQVRLASAQEDFAGQRAAFNATQSARSQQHGNFPQDVDARENLVNSQLIFDQSRGFFAREDVTTNGRRLELVEQRAEVRLETDFTTVEEALEVDKLISEQNDLLEKARVEARTAVKEAELAAQRVLAKADITQSLVHELSKG